MSMISEALDNICPDGMIERRPIIGGVKLRLRAVRNVPRWQASSVEQMVKAYRMPLPPGQGETEGSYQVYGGSDVGEDTKEAQY